MNLNRAEARRLAEAKLDTAAGPGGVVIVVDEEFPVGWVFFWNSARFAQTGELRDSLAGNAPVLVDRRDGSVHFTGTARPVEEYIERYMNRDPADERSWHPQRGTPNNSASGYGGQCSSDAESLCALPGRCGYGARDASFRYEVRQTVVFSRSIHRDISQSGSVGADSVRGHVAARDPAGCVKRIGAAGRQHRHGGIW